MLFLDAVYPVWDNIPAQYGTSVTMHRLATRLAMKSSSYTPEIVETIAEYLESIGVVSINRDLSQHDVVFIHRTCSEIDFETKLMAISAKDMPDLAIKVEKPVPVVHEVMCPLADVYAA